MNDTKQADKPYCNHVNDTKWLNKPYYSLDAYCKQTFGEKCYKIALNAGLSCPNRDGLIGTGGCIFCSAGGSGDFAQKLGDFPIEEQLKKGQDSLSQKQIGRKYIAYFQAYTNTYGPLPYLKEIFSTALSQPDVIGISIATRPDCLRDSILTLLADLKESYPDKFIWVELGLQTIHENTAKLIRRGYPLPVFEEACANLHKIGIPFIVHVILGLPNETPEMTVQTCRYLNHIPVSVTGDSIHPFGIKLQLLHILKDTALGDMYCQNLLSDFAPLTLEQYVELVIHCLEVLSEDIVIHRVTGDGPKDLLLAPLWSLNKRNVLNTIHKSMQQRHTFQGRCYYDAGAINTI